MAKLPRVLMKLFANNAANTEIGEFGSFAEGTPANPSTSIDIAAMMSTGAWGGGWLAAILGNNSPCIEDMNAFGAVFAYQLAYCFQAGVPEWETGTIYFTGSFCQSAGVIYKSLADNNTGNAVTDTTKWKTFANNPFTTLGDLLYSAANGVPTRLAGQTAANKYFLTQTGTGSASAAPVWQQFKAPTVQTLTAASGTYTLPAGVKWIRVRAVGAGGGGGGGGSGGPSTGSAGGTTTFGTTMISCNGGSCAGQGGPGAIGGSATLGTGPIGIAQTGAPGGATNQGNSGSGGGSGGGTGGSSPFGGGGGGGWATTVASSAAANSGSGGGGGGGITTAANGQGGSSGGYVDAIIGDPAATYAFTVGVGGAAGLAANGTGGNGSAGADGIIVVEEFYQ